MTASSSFRKLYNIDYWKNPCVGLTSIIVFLILAGFLFIIWSPSRSIPFFPYQECNCSKSSNVTTKDELELALEEVSMPNKTVIITVVNRAYVEQSVDAETSMLDLFLEAFWEGEDTKELLDHFLFVTVDETAYNRCKFKRLHCYKLVTEDVDFSGEKLYQSKDYIKMTWRKVLLLLNVLERGYNFVFTDSDIMWLRNPFAKLHLNSTEDIQISVDHFSGDPRPEKNRINTGFQFTKSNNKTISLFEKWYSQKDNSTGNNQNDQQALQDLMHNGLFTQLGLHVRFLETRQFSGFCQESQDITAVTTIHANCCRHIKAKFQDLTTVFRDWKQFKSAVAKNPDHEAANDIIRGFKWSTHTECRNSWGQR